MTIAEEFAIWVKGGERETESINTGKICCQNKGWNINKEYFGVNVKNKIFDGITNMKNSQLHSRNVGNDWVLRSTTSSH